MTQKEKAKDLFDKMFFSTRSIEVEQAKNCALIAVDEIINILGMPNIPKYYPIVTDEYWKEVKQEIEKL